MVVTIIILVKLSHFKKKRKEIYLDLTRLICSEWKHAHLDGLLLSHLGQSQVIIF